MIDAAKSLATPQREVHRAVAALLQNRIEDIELIWNALSREERAQLRPVIEQAAGIDAKASALISKPEQPDVSRDAHLNPMMEQMPPVLAMRLLACLDAPMQISVGGQADSVPTSTMTDHARAAWRVLCLEYAQGMEPAAPRSVPPVLAPRETFLARVLRHARSLAPALPRLRAWQR